MARHQKDPLRPLIDTEQQTLLACSRSQTAPAVEVIRAQILLRVAQGATYEAAARAGCRRSGKSVSIRGRSSWTTTRYKSQVPQGALPLLEAAAAYLFYLSAYTPGLSEIEPI